MHDNNIFTLSLPSIMLENSLFPFFSGTSLLKRALKRKHTIHKQKLPLYYTSRCWFLKEQCQAMCWYFSSCISLLIQRHHCQALAKFLTRSLVNGKLLIVSLILCITGYQWTFDHGNWSPVEWLGARLTEVTFSGEISFLSKEPEFLHMLFDLVV